MLDEGINPGNAKVPRTGYAINEMIKQVLFSENFKAKKVFMNFYNCLDNVIIHKIVFRESMAKKQFFQLKIKIISLKPFVINLLVTQFTLKSFMKNEEIDKKLFCGAKKKMIHLWNQIRCECSINTCYWR